MRFYPMSVGQILDNTFRLYRMNFARFLAIVAVVQIPVFIVSLLLRDYFASLAPGGPLEDAEFRDFLPAIVGALIMLLLYVLVTVWCSAALVRGVSDSYLGNSTGVGETYRKVAPKLLTIIVAGILIALVMLLCLVPGGLVAIISPGAGIFLFFVGFIVMIPVSLSFTVTTQAIVIENTSATRGMSRSRQLLRGNLGKTFGLMFLVGVIAYIINLIVVLLGGWLAAGVGGTTENMNLIMHGVNLIGKLLLTPIQAIPPILLYYDMRIRKEGFDLQMLARSIGSTYTGPQEPGAPGGPFNPDDPTAPYTARPRFPGE
jgi:hypothetical protein